MVQQSLEAEQPETVPYSQRGRPSDTVLEVRELVIKGLARLISANAESGVKHSLAVAYEPDPLKKLIFTKVFSRVMGQGTKLDTPEISAPVAARSRLLEMIKGPDVRLCSPWPVCWFLIFVTDHDRVGNLRDVPRK